MERRGELMLIQRAVNQGWDVPQAERDKAVALVNEVLSDPHATPRETQRAQRVLLAMAGQNIKDEGVKIGREFRFK